MAQRLPDGTVVMSNFGVSNPAGANATGAAGITNLGIHTGEIIKVIYPEDDNSFESELCYLVEVRHRSGPRSGGAIIWRCRLAVPYENQADFSRPTLRPATYDTEGKLIRNGTKVIVAAPNGDISQAFIIGCVKQQRRKDKKRKSPQKTNREYEGEFNGVHFSIEDDGSFSLTVPGATAQEGEADPNRDANNKGSTVRFDKSGDITISDKNGESITVSPGKKLIDVQAETYHLKAKTATIDGQRTNIGSEGSDENLVLGKKLVEALKELATILQTQNVSMSGNLGYPVPMNPEILARVKAWEMQYLQGGVAPILAKNKFTER